MTIDRRTLLQSAAAASALSLIPVARGQEMDALIAGATEVDIDAIPKNGSYTFAASAAPYSFKSSRPRKIHIELIGAGGGGGGASDTNRSPRGAGKGGAAGQYTFVPITLEETRYLLVVGQGGAGGMCRNNRWGTHGAKGGSTILSNARSGLQIVGAPGGAGGVRDGHPDMDHGENGGNLTGNGKLIATGGRGGRWDGNGAPGQTPGAGGGGHGGYNGPQTDHGGKGGDGRAIIYFID